MVRIICTINYAITTNSTSLTNSTHFISKNGVLDLEFSQARTYSTTPNNTDNLFVSNTLSDTLSISKGDTIQLAVIIQKTTGTTNCDYAYVSMYVEEL